MSLIELREMSFCVKMRIKKYFALHFVIDRQIVHTSEIAVTEVLQLRSVAKHNMGAAGCRLAVRFHAVGQRDVGDAFTISRVQRGAALVAVEDPAAVLRKIVPLVVALVGFVDGRVRFAAVEVGGAVV